MTDRIHHPKFSSRLASSLLFGLSGLEGVLVLVLLWSGSPDIQVRLSGLSSLRLGLIAATAIVTLLFILLGIWEWFKPQRYRTFYGVLLAYPKGLVVAFIVYVVILISGWLLVLSPMGSRSLLNYFTRWGGVFIWGILLGLQFFILTYTQRGFSFWANTYNELLNDPRYKRIRDVIHSPYTGWVLLGLAFLIGLIQINITYIFVDEGDNLTSGWLIARGDTLYKEVFTHHFPMPYYWVAGVVKLFGNSFVIARLSLLLLQVAVFILSMKVTGFYVPIGLTALTWSLSSLFNFGNLVIYQVFGAFFVVPVFMILFSLLIKRRIIKAWLLVLMGILMALAVLADPIMIYPTAVLLVGLLISGLKIKRETDIREGMRRAIIPGAAMVSMFALYLLYLAASDTMLDFYQSAILFNSQVYGNYLDFDPNRLDVLFKNLATGLDIFNARWRENTSFFLSLDDYFEGGTTIEAYYNWIFTSYFYRFVILVCGIGLALRGRLAAGLFLYLFAASLLVRSDINFHIMAFVLLSQFTAAYLLLGDFPKDRPTYLTDMLTEYTKLFLERIARFGWTFVRILIGVMLLWGAFRGAQFAYQNYEILFDPTRLIEVQKFGNQIRKKTCQRSDVELSFLPHDPTVNYITQIPPASKYTYMLPWVAEAGLEEYIEVLSSHSSAVVFIDKYHSVWGHYYAEDYLGKLVTFLDDNYTLVGQDLWMSPGLAEECVNGQP